MLDASGLWTKWLAESMMEKKIEKVGSETNAISNTAFMGESFEHIKEFNSVAFP